MKSLMYTLALIIATSLSRFDLIPLPPRTISGFVLDETNAPLLFANVYSECGAAGTQTDLNGYFSMTIPDSCDWIEVSYTGYISRRINMHNRDSVIVVLTVGAMLQSVEVIAYKIPLIEQDATTQGGIKTAEQIRNLPTKNINELASMTSGASGHRGKDINVRGSRSNATDYYLDGVRVTKKHNSILKTEAQQSSVGSNAFNTEDYSLIVENEFHCPTDEPLSTFSVDVDAASYSNMRRFLAYGQRPPKDAIRIEELINYFDYAYPQPQDDKPIAIYAETGSCPWAPGHKLVHIGIQGKAIPMDDLPASNLVFLLDVSGSMQYEDKLPLVIASFKMLVEQLREKDRVAIVVYAGSSGLVLPSTPGNKKEEIIAALEKLNAGGSTAGAAGIKQAYEVARENFITGGNNRVILATDGDFNVGVSSEGELVRIIEKERESGVFLTVLGFGTGNYMDNKMQELADHGNGNHGYVDNMTEARKVFVNEFGGTLFTIAKDVKIQVEFNPSLVGAYRLIGYENRMLEAEDFNDDLKDAGEIGSNHSVTALYEIIPAGMETAAVRQVDDLKYQKSKNVGVTSKTDELMTVKFRYKAPDGDTSRLIEHIIRDTDQAFDLTSVDFRFSAAVASFGMVLRGSSFAGNATIEDVSSWVSHSIGDDVNGYRKEFLGIVHEAKRIPDATADR